MDSLLYNVEESTEYADVSNASLYFNVSLMMENISHYYDIQPETANVLVDLVVALDTYCIPVLLSVGLVLNLTLVVTIRLSDLKNVPACFCFMSLGIIDNVYLIVMWIPWLSKRAVDIYNSKGFCQLTYYLNILAAFLSSWYIAIILTERCIATYIPTRASKYFSAFRTKCYVTFFSIFSLVAHLYLTWTSGVYTFNNISHCMVIFEHMEDMIIMRKIDIFFSFILPVTICTAMSIAIVCIMHFGQSNNSDKGIKSQQSTVTEIALTLRTSGVKSFCKHTSITEKSKKERKQRIRETNQSKRLTYTCLVMTMLYLILTVPHNVLKTKITFSGSDPDVKLYSRYLRILEKVYVVNFVFKAIVYFILLPEMRRCFVGLVVKFRKTLNRKHVKQQSTAL